MNNNQIEENETLRSQAVEQFREWIQKHPKIKKCRTDEKFLLRFLRTKKFSIPDACQLLENYLSSRKTLPHLFENFNVENAEMKYFLENQCMYVLPEVDKKGRTVMFADLGNFDGNICTAKDCLRYANLGFEYLSLDERSQLNGVVTVTDCARISVPFAALWTPTYLKDFVHCWQKTYPLRFQLMYYVNLPPFVNTIFMIFKSFLSEKMKSRLKVVKNYDEISQEIGIDILPKEFGGKVPARDHAKDFEKRLIVAQEEILAINDLDIEVSKSSVNFGNCYDADLDTAIVGSFRKIQVD